MDAAAHVRAQLRATFKNKFELFGVGFRLIYEWFVLTRNKILTVRLR